MSYWIDPFDLIPFELFEDQPGRSKLWPHSRNLATSSREGAVSLMPRVDIHEDPQQYLLIAEFPGVRKEDIKVSIENRTVTLRAEKKSEHHAAEQNEHKANLIRSEMQFGQFLRTITLPSPIDSQHAQANYKDGVLTLTLPKQDAVAAHQLTIH